ncbi:MAG: leucine-rich repeat protein [Treponema sp.]|nr:leucine-rich repeat protein [Treponema sp.]
MSTERMDTSQGTDRMDPGTARMDAGTARIGGIHGTIPVGGGIIFAEGQTIVLNGNNYVIDSLISKGSGEAVVYKMKMNDKHYALKHYKPNTPLSDTAKKVLTKIRDNPKEKVVKIIDIGNYYGQDFEIMEFAEGGTLSDFIKANGAIRDNKLKDVIAQINEGLQQLHGYYKTIYQDLKPDNIFFEDAQRTSLVLADFGISSVMQDGSDEVEVVASNTDLYAAPELARKGNNTTVEITPAVDYFALGITMYELWLGEQPFKAIKPITRERNIRDKSVIFPGNMPDDCKTLIQGLIDPLPKDRWRNEFVQKWLKGEILTLDLKKQSTVTSITYDPPLKFGNESASNQKELAALMDKYPKVGKDCLYDEIITKTLFEARDVTMYSDIKDVISLYGSDREAGLSAAIYTLDPERPFISRTGKICNSSEEIADTIMADSAHYMDELSKTNAGLYIYIAVTGGSQGKDTADTFRKFFIEYPPNRALTLVYLKLQSDGGIPLGSKRYLSADELAQEKDSSQIDLIKKAVKEKDSPLLVWISDKYGDYFKSTDEFGKQNIPEQFFLLSLIPFLSFTELSGNTGEAALQDLIEQYPGRSDLFETYITQGLPLKGQILDSPIKKAPIDYVVCNFNDLSIMHGSDTVYNLIRLLCKLGADVNEYSSDGRFPFINAVSRDDDLAKLLIELGADEDFVSKGGKICKSVENIADAIMSESAYYMDELKNPNTDLYLYFLATGGVQGMEIVENFRKYFKEYSSKYAIARVYLQLQSDLGITVGSKRYQSIEELKQEKNNEQIDLIKKAVMEKDSLLLAWISINEDYFKLFKTMEAFDNLPAPDQFHLLWLLPFLSYNELKGSNPEQSAISDLKYLIDYVPDRFNCFEAYAGQGLPLKGQILDSPDKKTPVDYVVYNFDDLSSKHGADNVGNLIKLLCKLGADINENSSDGTFPLVNAFEAFFAGKNDLIKLLLELGADTNQYREFLNRREEQERKEQEEKLGSEGKKLELSENKKRKERDDRERKRKAFKNIAAIKKILKIAVIFIPFSIACGYAFYNGWLAFLFDRHLSIPDTVTAIADNEYAGKQITSIDFPDSVTIIGDGAFSRNGLSSIVIPENIISVGENAFSGNRPTSISIGADVTIGENAFGHNFENFYLENGMMQGTYKRSNFYTNDWKAWYGDFGFRFNEGNISIMDYNGTGDQLVIPAEIGKYTVTIIEENAFSDNNLTSIVIPGSVTSIGLNAFANNPLTSVSLGANVTLGSDENNGVLGNMTGFNTSYANYGNRAGTYTRSDTNTTTWTRR